MSLGDDYEQRTFAQRYGFALGVGVVVLVLAGLVVGQMLSHKSSPPRRAPEVTMVRLAPPPPPPPQPPPPPPQQVQEQKMIEQTPVEDNEPKPDDKPAPATPDVGTNIKGDGGPDGFGLSGSGGGTRRGGSGSGGSGSRWGWWAGQAQSAIRDVLGRDPRTRSASFAASKIAVSTDVTGRIEKVSVSTGDAKTDEAIRAALVGQQLPPLPAGMPHRIVLRIAARRP